MLNEMMSMTTPKMPLAALRRTNCRPVMPASIDASTALNMTPKTLPLSDRFNTVLTDFRELCEVCDRRTRLTLD